MTTDKIEAFWKDATSEDVARVMKGETVEARFWDDEHRGKAVGLLCGWTQDRPIWYCEQTGFRAYFENCQVYREPSWHANKPDPGEGYRLLGKFPDERKFPTDEAWDCHLNQWRQTLTNDGDQVKTVWYRRRIEPVESKPKHYVLRVGDTANLPSGQTITITEKGFEVAQ